MSAAPLDPADVARGLAAICARYPDVRNPLGPGWEPRYRSEAPGLDLEDRYCLLGHYLVLELGHTYDHDSWEAREAYALARWLRYPPAVAHEMALWQDQADCLDGLHKATRWGDVPAMVDGARARLVAAGAL